MFKEMKTELKQIYNCKINLDSCVIKRKNLADFLFVTLNTMKFSSKIRQKCPKEGIRTEIQQESALPNIRQQTKNQKIVIKHR